MMPPVIIGATGGSGTRVVAKIVQRAGVFLGTAEHRNEFEDARSFVDFYDRWINRFLSRERDPFTAIEDASFVAEFAGCVARHREGVSGDDAPWGWKEPRSMYLLPFFAQQCPGLKFVHVVRDRRDMAFSRNQTQLRKHGDAVLTPDYDALATPVRAVALWNRMNTRTAEFGLTMGARYLLVRFEDLCQDPDATTQAISRFVGSDEVHGDPVDVMPPASIGRWRTLADAGLAEALEAHAGEALRRFRYLV